MEVAKQKFTIATSSPLMNSWLIDHHSSATKAFYKIFAQVRRSNQRMVIACADEHYYLPKKMGYR
jgi:hypothetical protein